MAEEAPEGDYLEGARETIRGAAKWLVASFGAVGAVLVAGSQLSSIGELQTGSGRLQTAMLGVAIGLVAILGGTWVAVNLLLPVKWGLSELANRWTDAGARKGQGLGYWKRLRYGEIDFLARNPEYLGDFESPAEIRETYDRAEADDPDIEDLVALIERVCSIAAYRTLRGRFLRSRWYLSIAAAIAAAGIGLFAWAANPPDPEHAPPSLRGADLSSTDLSGANLRGADLTGADLTNANLDGAQLTGATVEGVTWSSTTCPDGVNSDDADGSCEGHLGPMP